VGLLTCLSVFPPAGGAEAEKVAEVRVQGNEQTAASTILSKIKTRAGADYDEATVRSDEKALLETGRFESVVAARTYEEEGVVVVFTVAERPLVAAVGFKGNSALKDKDLAGELAFGVSEAINRYSVEAGRQAILNKYRSKGYHFASVQLDEEAFEKRREVIYIINEGPQAIVRKIVFNGNDHFSAFRLRRAIGSSAKLWPFVTGYLDVEQVDRDVQAITNLYIGDGFLDVKVSRDIQFSQNKAKVVLVFAIVEGPRFRVNKVIFEGNTVFGDEELAGQLKLRQGEFFTAIRLRRDVDRIGEVYGAVGYVEAEVTSSRRFLDPTAPPPEWAQNLDGGKPALLDIVFRVGEADQYMISRIDIRGNTVTQSRIIRRELRFFPEQLLNMSAVKESQNRLMETRLFDKVNITPVESGPKTKSLLVEVDEARTAQFLIGVGVNTNSGLMGTVSLTQYNFDITRWPGARRDVAGGQAFKGAGQTLSIVAEPGVEMMRFQVSWLEPYLFDKPYSLGAKAFVFTRKRESYDETRYGVVPSLGHRFKNRWYGELSGRLEEVQINGLDSDAPPEVVQDRGSHLLVGPKGSLVRDTTDSRWMPSRGDRLHFSYEQIGGDYSFGKAAGDYTIYRTVYMDALDRKHIISGRLAAGDILGSAPVFEKFYGGGIGSLRGFDYRGISPRSKGTNEPIGGDMMLYAGTEYTFPLIGQELRGVVFLDTGTVEESSQITAYRASAGVGLRLHLPMFGPVPMSLEFGFPLRKANQDETQLVSFSLGWTF